MNKDLNESYAGTIKTVSDLLIAAKQGYDEEKGDWNNTIGVSNRRKYSYSSVAKAASKMIAVYPLLCSRNVSLETAQMVSKYLEAKGAQMLQLALQANNIYDAKSGMEYLSRFHQNLNVGGSSIDVFAHAIDTMIQDRQDDENAERRSQQEDRYYNDESAMEEFDRFFYENDVEYTVGSKDLNDILKSIQEFAEKGFVEPYDTNLNPVSLNDYIVNESYDGTYTVRLSAFTEKANNNKKYAFDNSAQKYVYSASNINSKSYGELLRNQDVKKMNDALPTLLVVKFYSTSNAANYTEFLVGVKTSVIPVNTDEILKKIANDNEDGKFFTNLIRVGTGEIGALDFIFGLSRTADDLASMKKKGSLGDTWRLLQNRAYAAKEAIKKNRNNPYAAITTVIITKEDADLLYKEENIDITKPGIAKHFMESYNLLGFGIVNDVLESLNIMFDDDNNYFEELSYKMLQRENNNDVIVKAMSLMNKVR